MQEVGRTDRTRLVLASGSVPGQAHARVALLSFLLLPHPFMMAFDLPDQLIRALLKVLLRRLVSISRSPAINLRQDVLHALALIEWLLSFICLNDCSCAGDFVHRHRHALAEVWSSRLL